MHRLLLSFFLVFTSMFLMGQELTEKPPLNPSNLSNWKYDGFSYADFGTGEQHSYFSLMYKLNPSLFAELQVFYDRYRTGDITDFSYRTRWYPTKKIYFFTGVGGQIQQRKVGGGVPIVPLRLINGVGYEPKKNITIEAVHDLNFNANNVGKNASSSLITLKGKYRF